MHLVIWVTSACNLACKYCYEGDEKTNQMMDRSTADRILNYIDENAEENEEIRMVFHGGEPLLNFNLIKYFVEKISGKFERTKYQLTTNGTIMNGEIAQFLLDNFHSGISLSIDGKEDTHNSNRIYTDGRGSYGAVIKNIGTYFSRDQYNKFVIRMTLTSRNVSELFDNCMHLINMGFSTVITALDQYDKGWNSEKFKELQGQVYQIYQEAKKNNYEEKGIYLSLLDWKNRVKGECKISPKILKVYVNGDVYPCVASAGDRSLILGNIFADPFANMDLIEKLCKINKTRNLGCDNCKHKPYCVNSRCKLLNKAYNGDFLKPSEVECAYQNMIVNLQNLI